MFNASSSKSNSSTRGTLHFTRQPRSCEVAPTLRQFHFQTLTSNTSDSSSSLFHFRCSSSHAVPNGMKLMAISKICVSAYKYNKSMLHRPPSHLLKRSSCYRASWGNQSTATATKFHRHAGTTTRIFSHALGRSSRQEAERPQWEHGLAFFTSTRSGKRTSKVLKHDKPSPYWSFFIEQCVRDHSFCGAAGFWSSCQQVKQFALGFLKAFWSLVHTQQESPNRSESLRIINQEEVWHMQHCSEAFSELLFIRNHNLDNIC